MRGLPDAHLQANQNSVDAVDLKNRLCVVQADRRSCFAYLAPPNRGGLNSAHFHWHSRAAGKAVHAIKSGYSTARLACFAKDTMADNLIASKRDRSLCPS
jgi:hypothetical protein